MTLQALFTIQVVLLVIGCALFGTSFMVVSTRERDRLLLAAFLCGVASLVLWLLQKTIVLSLFSIGIA